MEFFETAGAGTRSGSRTAADKERLPQAPAASPGYIAPEARSSTPPALLPSTSGTAPQPGERFRDFRSRSFGIPSWPEAPREVERDNESRPAQIERVPEALK